MVLTICSLRTFLLLSLSCPRNLWVSEVDEPRNRPRVYWGAEVHCGKRILGRGSALRENILGRGSAVPNLSWGTEDDRAKYPGARKCSTEIILGSGRRLQENILGRGSAVPKISWVTEADCRKISWGTEDDRDSPPPLLSRQVPPATGVLFRAPV